MKSALAVLLFLKASVPAPPSWDGMQQMGCDVSQIRTGDVHWYVNVWIQFPDHRWQTRNYSIRDANERTKALADCDRWMKEIVEKIRKDQKK